MGKLLSLQWKNPENNYLNQVIKFNITSNESYQHSVSLSMILRIRYTSVVFISTYQNVTKNVSMTEHKNKLRNCQDGKKISTEIISSVKSWIRSWDQKKKDISGKTGNT